LQLSNENIHLDSLSIANLLKLHHKYGIKKQKIEKKKMKRAKNKNNPSNGKTNGVRCSTSIKSKDCWPKTLFLWTLTDACLAVCYLSGWKEQKTEKN